ncbi:MAG: DUF115 domain-containing protein [Methylomonas sp.]|nr:DUF115 domain-containing protein [Methylomonas sp.]PPD19803.1 MAG: hypothetical protein CTY23_10850 [Methylomonas sp.]PPD25794.1 MAG: hypothetical protein CTY22_07395 [Methylomonas sp.]PPD36958.1 MAG: hypothetical protein CTY17_11025 [Methylomonas sp.]PPD37258.1 MAG: hypothetical protein CTY21_07395 [Methylomonas sp.]
MTTASIVEQHSVGPVAVNSFGERVLFGVNRHVFDKISARTVFEARLGETLFAQDALTVVIGSDSGLLPRYLVEKGLPNGSRYIFLEPEAVLAALEQNGLLEQTDDRLVCISLEQWNETINRFKIGDYFYLDAVRCFNALCAQDDYIDAYAELSWHIAEVLAQLHWHSNMELGMEAFLTRQIYNLVDNRVPASLLKNAFDGKTVVILAGGPSLDQALPWVKANRDHLVVFAVSRIARQLLACELAPDVVFSVDPTELSFDVSKEMLAFGERPLFISSHHTVPLLQSQWLGRMLYLGSRVPWKSPLNVDNLSSAGPTVTNTALNVAHAFGFKRIVLAGVDLCFTRLGVTHASGSNEQLAGPRFDLTSLQVDTYGGFKAPTSSDFAAAIASLNAQARSISASGCEILNVSAGAARVESIRYCPLASISLDAQPLDVEGILASRLGERDKTVAADFDTLATELQRAVYKIEKIADLATQAARLNDAMFDDATGLIADVRDKKKLDKLEKTLRRDYKEFSRLVKKFGIRKFIRLAKPFADDDWNAGDVKELGRVYYEAYGDGAQKLLKLLRETQARVEARRQEVLAQPDVGLMLAQCEQERCFGRVRLWRHRLDMTQWPQDALTLCDDYENRFWRVIEDRDTRHLVQVKRHSDLSVVKRRAALLFKHKKIDDLWDLSASLDSCEDTMAARPHRHLIAGYLAELAHDPNAALDAYHPIVDAGQGLLEEALTRIAAISLDGQQWPDAMLALDCLAQLNAAYLPMFADMARLQGDLLKAIDAYRSYIEQFPHDDLVQLKLAQLYIDGQIYDGADLMLDFILHRQPDHPMAGMLKQQMSALRLAQTIA